MSYTKIIKRADLARETSPRIERIAAALTAAGLIEGWENWEQDAQTGEVYVDIDVDPLEPKDLRLLAKYNGLLSAIDHRIVVSFAVYSDTGRKLR